MHGTQYSRATQYAWHPTCPRRALSMAPAALVTRILYATGYACALIIHGIRPVRAAQKASLPLSSPYALCMAPGPLMPQILRALVVVVLRIIHDTRHAHDGHWTWHPPHCAAHYAFHMPCQCNSLCGPPPHSYRALCIAPAELVPRIASVMGRRGRERLSAGMPAPGGRKTWNSGKGN